MTNNMNKCTDEKIAALPEVMAKLYKGQRLLTGVNARVLHGVDVSKLNTVKYDGMNGFPGDFGKA